MISMIGLNCVVMCNEVNMHSHTPHNQTEVCTSASYREVNQV